MQLPLPFSARALLHAISGVAYAADRDGVIIGVSRGPFLPERNRPPTAPPDHSDMVGKSLFSIIRGEPVRQSYLTLHRSVWSGDTDAIGFAYRCDAPDIERHMFMSLSRISDGPAAIAVLYQSIIISEVHRPPLPLFAFEWLAGPAATADQIVTLCSYCQSVAWPTDAYPDQREWIGAVEFYRRGGRTDAVVSHGICEACLDRIVAPVRSAATRS
jgi:hypothetical protein